jgi:two-component system response regulator GlrR
VRVSPAGDPAAAPPHPSVLLVEDEPDHRRALALTLRLGGYAPRECGTGEEALTMAAEAVPDAVVLDVRLPGIDGIEVFGHLRDERSTRSVPVVLISAHATIPNAVQRDPRSRFVPKPFHPDQLLDHLAELLGTASPRTDR